MSTVTKRKARKQRTFLVTFHIEGDDYRISPLSCDPAIGSKAFRFAKLTGDGEIYDLYADGYGLHCQCKGYLQHGHCKHMETVQAAGKLFSLAATVPAPAAPIPAVRKPAFRSTGDLAANNPEAYARLQEDWSDYPAAPQPTEAEIDAMAEYHFGPADPAPAPVLPGGKFSKREADFA